MTARSHLHSAYSLILLLIRHYTHLKLPHLLLLFMDGQLPGASPASSYRVLADCRLRVRFKDSTSQRHIQIWLNGQSSQPNGVSASIWIWIVKHRACMSGTRSRWSARLQPRVSASPSHCIYIHLDLHPTAPSDHAIEWHNQTGHDCSNNDRPHRQRQGNQLCKVWHDCSKSLASLPKDSPASFATLHDMVLCVCAAKTI